MASAGDDFARVKREDVLKLRLADGTEYMVAKKRKRRKVSAKASPDTSVDENVATGVTSSYEASVDGALGGANLNMKETKRIVGTSSSKTFGGLAAKIPPGAGKASLGLSLVLLVLYKKVKTGNWFEWAFQSYDDASSRRTAVQDEEELGQLNMLSCSNCGYTIFPALGRTFRFDLFTQKCANCGAVGTFYDKNDPNDKRNQKEDGSNEALEKREYMKKWIKADTFQAVKAREELERGVALMESKGRAVPTELKKDIRDKQKQDKEDLEEAQSSTVIEKDEEGTRGATTVISLDPDDGELTSEGAADGKLGDDLQESSSREATDDDDGGLLDLLSDE